MDRSIERTNRLKLRWGLILIVAPFALIVAAIIAYALVNFVFGSMGDGTGSSDNTLKVLINVVLYIIGAISVIGFIPALVGGIILIVLRKDPHAVTAHTTATSAGSLPVTAQNVPGRTQSVIGLVFAFVGLGVPGLVLSIIGYKMSKKTGRADIISTLGIIFNSISVAIGIIYIILFGIGFVDGLNHPERYRDNSSSSSSLQPGSPSAETPELFN